MAIEIINTNEDTLQLEISDKDVKHLEALRNTVARLGFKDEKCAFEFLLAVLVLSATRAFAITTVDGELKQFSPIPALLESEGKHETYKSDI